MDIAIQVQILFAFHIALIPSEKSMNPTILSPAMDEWPGRLAL